MNEKTATMLYDGDCEFCARAVHKWQRKTGAAIVYEPYQRALSQFPRVSEKACKKAVQLITADGAIYSGAHAIFKAFALAGRTESLHWLYHHLPFFDKISEGAYQCIARHRMFVSRIYHGFIKRDK